MSRDVHITAVEGSRLLDNAQTSPSPKGGSLNNPVLTDSLADTVCSHQGPHCGVLWRTCQLVPKVPLRLRSWLKDEIDMQDMLHKILTHDQHFDQDPKGIGICVTILGVDTLDLVNSYWTGKVEVMVKIPARVFAHDLSCVSAKAQAALLAVADGDNSAAARQLVLDLLAQDVADYGSGKVRRSYEFKTVPDMSDAERLMRFAMIGVVNWYRGQDAEKDYPVIGGDTAFCWLESSDRLTATWTVESRWFNQPSLRTFPFDTNELCAIFWTKSWSAVGITDGLHCWGLGDSFQEFDMYGFHGDEKPLSGWDPYICENNVVPNDARPQEVIVYGRFWVRRKPFYFIASVYLPAAIVALLGGAAIAVAHGSDEINGIVARSESPLSFLAGLILTMVAMKFSYADSLPKLGYLTMLDFYMTVNFCCLVVAAGVVTIFREDQLSDMHASWIYVILLLVFNLVYFGAAWHVFRIPVEISPRISFPAS